MIETRRLIVHSRHSGAVTARDIELSFLGGEG